MCNVLTRDTVLTLTPWCVVREQEEQFLVYNSRTDELHLLPPTGFYAYQLCNGWSTVGEIEDALAIEIRREPTVLGDRLREFFGMLVARGILAVEQ